MKTSGLKKFKVFTLKGLYQELNANMHQILIIL